MSAAIRIDVAMTYQGVARTPAGTARPSMRVRIKYLGKIYLPFRSRLSVLDPLHCDSLLVAFLSQSSTALCHLLSGRVSQPRHLIPHTLLERGVASSSQTPHLQYRCRFRQPRAGTGACSIESSPAKYRDALLRFLSSLPPLTPPLTSPPRATPHAPGNATTPPTACAPAPQCRCVLSASRPCRSAR